MAQASWPIVGQNFSDVDWRDLFGTESGVIGDRDGSSYRITLPTDSDIAQVGSTTQASTAQVAGFGHRILAGQTEPITIPAASGSARTDIVALRYDPAFTGLPGPVRVVLIAGTSSGLPSYDDAPPGIEDLPLWSVTRNPGEALSQATIKRLYTRLTPTLGVAEGAPLPLSSPLDTLANQGAATYRRQLGSSQTPEWQRVGPISGGRTRTFRRGTGTDLYSGLAELVGGTWTGAPSGQYVVHATIVAQANANRAAELIVDSSSGILTRAPHRADVPSAFAATIANSFSLTWGGGDLSVVMRHNVTGGDATVYNSSTKIDVVYLGP